MDILPNNFRTFHRLGLWSEDTGKESKFQTIFRIFSIIVLTYVTFSEVIELLYLDVQELIPNLFLATCYLGLMAKMSNFFIRYGRLNKLLDKFRSHSCQPQTEGEKKMLEKYGNYAGHLHDYYINFGIACCVSIVAFPLVNVLRNANTELPIKAYHPYNISKPMNFWLTYVFQAMFEPYYGVLNMAFDTLTYGFIIMATGQIDLCCYRLQSYINDGSFRSMICKRKWINHHVLAMSIINDIQSIFMGVIVPFFFSSLIMLCAVVFQMYKENPFSIDFFGNVLCYALIIMEIFFYCWSGNELIMKYNDVANAAYNSDWTVLHPRDRKVLLFILRIGQRTITISLKGQCGLSVNTFSWIVKTSYGTFNLLKRI